jgi:hypothetical protein
MQRIGFLLMPRYEACLYKNAQQEEEWLAAVVISVPDERYGSTGGLWTQGPVKLLEELSTIFAMPITMSSRAWSFSSFHAA